MEYDEQLDRALDRTPDIDGGGERFDVPTPEVREEGHVTVLENFQSIVDALGRDAHHVLKELQSELGTSAHIDESGRARLTGDFRQSRVADAIESYADGYVLCPECGLPDTQIEREQGAELLQCDACGARSSTGG